MKTENEITIGWKNTDWSVPIRPTGTKPVEQPSLETLIEKAHREAVAIANTTAFPSLVLPLLREEKETEARKYWQRRQTILKRSEKIVQILFPKYQEQAAA